MTAYATIEGEPSFVRVRERGESRDDFRTEANARTISVLHGRFLGPDASVEARQSSSEIKTLFSSVNGTLVDVPTPRAREDSSAESDGVDGGDIARRARNMGRLLSAQIDAEEYERILSERAELLERSFQDGLRPPEQRRLRMLEWHLERIDDARYGPGVDLLERAASTHESFAHELSSLVDRLSDAMRPSRSDRRR